MLEDLIVAATNEALRKGEDSGQLRNVKVHRRHGRRNAILGEI